MSDDHQTDAVFQALAHESRTRRLYFNTAPMQMIYDRWTPEYSAYWSSW